MTIEQIDNSKVLIILGSKDMENFSLEYNTLSFEHPHSKKILKRLLSVACTKADICVNDKKILVEAIPHNNGCLILLTFKNKTERKIYKIKSTNKSICCCFCNTENLFSFSSSMKNSQKLSSASLYFLNDKYFLVIDDICDFRHITKRIKEYCCKFTINKIFIASVKEYGKVIIKYHAIDTLNKHFN